jgi:hypothetical protein
MCEFGFALDVLPYLLPIRFSQGNECTHRYGYALGVMVGEKASQVEDSDFERYVTAKAVCINGRSIILFHERKKI